jgi:hypothetical protein
MALSCSNQCEKNWCCRTGINLCPTEDAAMVLAFRGMQVYKASGRRRLTGYVGVSNLKCFHLQSSGCGVQAGKPDFCKNFPDPNTSFLILPSKCPFSSMADETVETMENITNSLMFRNSPRKVK